MASTFGAAPARRLSASCFQPSPVVGGVSHAVRSGCAMICCSSGLTVYARTTGTRVNMSLKGSGEALAQLIAERENPKTDLWFGGTGDPHLQAAEQGLTLEYKSPSLAQLHDWAQQQARQSGYRTVGI